ncbi:MAG: hypothetical protein ABWX67_13970 [Allosphingosinicella sp.]
MTNEGGVGPGLVLVQLVPLMIIMLLVVVPFVRILRRAGRSGWWALLLFIPALGWAILPWVIAYMRWERPPEPLERVFG